MIQLPEHILSLLKDRAYFHEGEHTWEDLSRRVAKALASAESAADRAMWEERFFELLATQKFVNSSPTLMNADVNYMGGLSSCFVIDIQDDLKKIHTAMGRCAKIYQYNGGVGFDISPLRPSKAPLGTAHGKAGGPVAFMEEFNLAAEIAVRHNQRKSATKIDMQVWHPDIREFIHCKDDGVSLTNMNISVSIPDRFMECVRQDLEWPLMFPDYGACKDLYDAEWDGDIEKWGANGRPIKTYEIVRARDLYREICESAWKRGDPGVNFYDHLNLRNPNKHIGRVTGTNPCAEFNSLPYTSCCLGSFNLMAYMRGGQLDLTALQQDIPTAVRMLDNVITLNKFPLKKIRKMTQANRSIGIGVMGLADALYAMKMPYGSDDTCNYVNYLMSMLTDTAEEASANLADERDAYKHWKGSMWERNSTLMRNSDVTSIAPTGTISTICGVSSSIEPVFGLVYERHTADDRTFYVVNKVFEAELRARGLYSDELLRRIRDNHGSCVGVDGVPEDMQRVFVTAYDVTPDQHIAVCAAVQDAISLSVSKTVNLPNDATVEDIEAVYLRAFDHGLLGITVYRDGCRDNQVLTTGSAPKATQDVPEVVVEEDEGINVRPLWGDKMAANDDVDGLTRKIQTGCGSVHINAFFDRGTHRMTKVYVGRGGRGGCTALINGMGRMLSNMLRLGDTPEGINEELQDTMPCGSYGFRLGSGKQTSKGFSCASAIGWALLDMKREYERKHERDEVRGQIVTVLDFFKD